jgi:hypothetical protein
MEKLAADSGSSMTMTTSWGLTETAPASTSAHFPIARSDVLGVPLPGVGLALVPVGEKTEVRVKGPNGRSSSAAEPCRPAGFPVVHGLHGPPDRCPVRWTPSPLRHPRCREKPVCSWCPRGGHSTSAHACHPAKQLRTRDEPASGRGFPSARPNQIRTRENMWHRPAGGRQGRHRRVVQSAPRSTGVS